MASSESSSVNRASSTSSSAEEHNDFLQLMSSGKGEEILPYSKEAADECQWQANGVKDHIGLHKFKEYSKLEKKILDNVLEAVGRTPLVKLHRIPKEYGLECNLYGKAEFVNAGGSVKDRIALRMVEMAEESGQLKPGMTVIEPTSGNTGIGLALVCAVKGYGCIIVMPHKMSREKEITIRALGAEIVRSDDDAPYDSANSHIGIAFKLHKEIPDSIILNQYINCANPMAHYESTAEEILESLDNKVDMVVIGAGTGGTFTGIAKKFEKRVPDCKVIGVDPVGSVIAGDENHAGKHFEVKTDDKNTFLLARKLNRCEGILSGGSSGAILFGAIKSAKSLKKGQNCVIILPDSIRNYLTKFLLDDWMVEKNFTERSERETIFPRNTFDISAVYDPETQSTQRFQTVSEPWPETAFSPHRPMLVNTIDEVIGWTPLVRLNKIPRSYGVEAEILVKCEYLNVGGSVKDRVARKMVEIAEQTGDLIPGKSVVIEPTSGNTGIGLAMICAIKGYRCIIVMPNKMSREKEYTLRALGAEIVRTENHHAYSDADSHIGVALRLQREIPNAIILDQYRNVGNPLAHFQETAEEILYACDNKLDAIVIGAGTGGTVTGVAKKIKQRVPGCKIYAVDPEGSLLADPSNKETHGYEVEGTGYDFVPAVLDRSLVDEWIKTSDSDSFATARQLIRQEGFLCGGSSGANVWAALQVGKRLGAGKRVVTVLPDSIRNYMTKFVDPEWLKSKNFDIE